ncbi:CinA family protein [Microbacterium gorillae]|uniref:CinA family protein n=1 Tax=Microbacterium gorillae TaxID=1231063 RepID=UPI00058D1E3E|nr:nicotinamide-nucleotide amidohydrolase family protein [Microbacterium gorillae]
MSVAVDLLDALVARGLTIACAESLTGGQVVSALVDVPGASRAVRGGVVAYDTAVKASVLGVDGDLLATRGAVDPDVARQMAERVRALLATDAGPASIGVATTGVAGPDPQDGHPVGTVFIAVATAAATVVHELHLSGDRAAIRTATVTAVLELARSFLTEES